MVAQVLYRFVHRRGDDHLRDGAIQSCVHPTRGAGAPAATDRGSPGPRTRMGVVPEYWPGINMGRATSSMTRCGVAMRWGHLG